MLRRQAVPNHIGKEARNMNERANGKAFVVRNVRNPMQDPTLVPTIPTRLYLARKANLRRAVHPAPLDGSPSKSGRYLTKRDTPLAPNAAACGGGDTASSSRRDVIPAR